MAIGHDLNFSIASWCSHLLWHDWRTWILAMLSVDSLGEPTSICKDAARCTTSIDSRTLSFVDGSVPMKQVHGKAFRSAKSRRRLETRHSDGPLPGNNKVRATRRSLSARLNSGPNTVYKLGTAQPAWKKCCPIQEVVPFHLTLDASLLWVDSFTCVFELVHGFSGVPCAVMELSAWFGWHRFPPSW